MSVIVRKNAEKQHSANWQDPTDTRVISALFSRPWWSIVAIALCLSAAAAYLKVATPFYTATSKLRIQQDDPQAMGAPDPVRTPDETTSFLNAELAVITSTPVLELALQDSRLKECEFVRPANMTVPALQESVKARLGRKDGIISVQYDSPSSKDAALMARAIVDAYVSYESNQREETSSRLLNLLDKERSQRQANVRAKADQMLGLLRSAKASSFDEKRLAEELISFRSNLRAAHSDTVTTESYYREALAAISSDPVLLARFEESKGTAVSPKAFEANSAQIRTSIADMELRKQELTLSRKYLPQHPQMQSIQGQLDRLHVLYATLTYARWIQASQREEDIQKLVTDREAQSQLIADRSTQYGRLEMELKRDERQLDMLEERIIALQARKGSSGLHIKILEPAQASLFPTKPQKLPILAGAACLGLILGTIIAYLREISAKRFAAENSTTPHTQSVFRSLPVMTPEYSPRDLWLATKPTKRFQTRQWQPTRKNNPGEEA